MVIHSDIDMFNLFKRKQTKSIQEWEYTLLKSIAKTLPSKYSFLIHQLNPGFILDSVPNEFLETGWKRIICNQKKYESIRDNTVNYKLEGIKIYDEKAQGYKNLELDLYEGILIGYKVDDNSGYFDYNNIDLKNLREVPYNQSKGYEQLKEIIGTVKKEFLAELDLENTIEIEVPEGKFYTIKDLEDGNYLAMNKNGAVFGLLHDPYGIDKLFDTKESFFDALSSNKFIISEYYKTKIS